jgi:hypothetical protein
MSIPTPQIEVTDMILATQPPKVNSCFFTIYDLSD